MEIPKFLMKAKKIFPQFSVRRDPITLSEDDWGG